MLDMTKETAPETNIELLFQRASDGFLLGLLRNAIKFLGVVQILGCAIWFVAVRPTQVKI